MFEQYRNFFDTIIGKSQKMIFHKDSDTELIFKDIGNTNGALFVFKNNNDEIEVFLRSFEMADLRDAIDEWLISHEKLEYFT